jgi:hypothetical protein
MSDLFRAYQVSESGIPAYFIESTALNNVDDEPEESNQPPHPDLTRLEPDDAIEKMAEHLALAEQTELVVIVHGFNNPQKAVLQRYAQAFEAAANDEPIRTRGGLVCLGYRWPSEKILQPRATLYSAAPFFLIGLFLIAVLFFALALAWPYLLIPVPPWSAIAFYTLGLLLAVPLAVLLLRLAVYFRDSYRATHYGVPDLVEVIRQLDRKVTDKAKSRGRVGPEYRNLVKLSFIGHSMGGFVVTNAVRILSDIFSPPPPSRKEPGYISVSQFAAEKGFKSDNDSLNAGNAGKDSPPEIGTAFTLARLVLVSPDIPAETLLSNRNNFLGSSLRRFREAYLFSNGGDVVLRMVSTIANYFSFPTRSRDHGLRLGNTEALADCYGVANLESLKANSGNINKDSFLQDLRVGGLTLKEMYHQIKDEGQAEEILPQIFTYFDCTDYIEDGVGVLTRATPKQRVCRQDSLSAWSHVRLLYDYLFHHQKPDVHSGYFNENARLARQLIFRVACLGLADTLRSYYDETNAADDEMSAPLDAFSRVCAKKQIKILLSPRTFKSLRKKEEASGEKMM